MVEGISVNQITDVKGAITAYLDGKKVRRHITMEDYLAHENQRKLDGKRPSNRHTWWKNWVWNDGGKKTELQYDDSDCWSPIEAFERNGYDANKLWEIKC